MVLALSYGMAKYTKAGLQKLTKDNLIKLAKSSFGLILKSADSKEELISKILNASGTKAVLSKGNGSAKSALKGTKPSQTKTATPAKKIPAAKPAARKKAAAPAEKEPKKETPRHATTKSRKAEAPAPPLAETRGPQPSAPPFKGIEVVPALPSYRAKRKGSAEKLPPMNVRDEELVEESKYYVAAAQEHLEGENIPWRYEDNKAILFVRDPYWTFASWDLHPKKPEETASKHNINLTEFRITLRVYDVTDVEFNGSNAHRHFDIEANNIRGSWYINVPEDDRNYLFEVGLKNQRGDFYMMARSNMVCVPRWGVSARTDEEWMIADEEFWRMYALSGGFKTRGSSMELMEMMRKQISGETSSGMVSSFGGSLRPRPAKDQFWFWLDCELIVYGATEPDATVTMMGKKVELRPDGTFSARFSLPDSVQPIETTAVSANRKFEKTITPTVSRSTTTFQNRELHEETEE